MVISAPIRLLTIRIFMGWMTTTHRRFFFLPDEAKPPATRRWFGPGTGTPTPDLFQRWYPIFLFVQSRMPSNPNPELYHHGRGWSKKCPQQMALETVICWVPKCSPFPFALSPERRVTEITNTSLQKGSFVKLQPVSSVSLAYVGCPLHVSLSIYGGSDQESDRISNKL